MLHSITYDDLDGDLDIGALQWLCLALTLGLKIYTDKYNAMKMYNTHKWIFLCLISCVLNLFKHFQINSSNIVECEDSLTGPTGVKAKVTLVSNDNLGCNSCKMTDLLTLYAWTTLWVWQLWLRTEEWSYYVVISVVNSSFPLFLKSLIFVSQWSSFWANVRWFTEMDNVKVIKEFRKKDAIKAKLICSHLSLFLKLLVIKEEIVFV